MHSRYKSEGDEVDDRRMAELASVATNWSMDTYSGYGVGSAVEVEFDTPYGSEYHVYQGTNINLTGMEVKIHAEQLALFTALVDAKRAQLMEHMSINRVVVHTSEDDLSVNCGHCFQVFDGVCQTLDQSLQTVKYDGVAGQEYYDDRGNPEGVHWNWDKSTLAKRFISSYVENREDN